MALGTILFYLSIAERLARLWGVIQRSAERKKKRDEKSKTTDGSGS